MAGLQDGAVLAGTVQAGVSHSGVEQPGEEINWGGSHEEHAGYRCPCAATSRMS